MALTRRFMLISLPLAAGLEPPRAAARPSRLIAGIEKRYGGRLGVFAVDTGTYRTWLTGRTSAS